MSSVKDGNKESARQDVGGNGAKALSCSLLVDSSVMDGQISEALSLVEALSPLELEALRDQLPGYLDSLGSDVVLGDVVTTRRANGSAEIRYVPRLGENFERLVSALRARKFDDV